MCSNQHGFVPRQSCTSQLLTAMEEWTKAIQDNKYLDVVYLDFSKAFDTIPHYHKLQSYGIQGRNFMKICVTLYSYCSYSYVAGKNLWNKI